MDDVAFILKFEQAEEALQRVVVMIFLIFRDLRVA